MWEPRLDQLFDDGAQHEWPKSGRSTLEVATVADVVLPSGHLVVCDPGSLSWGVIKVAAEVPPGRYPVQLSILSWDDMRRCTAARVVLGSDTVEVWAPAWPGDNRPGGFGVDGGQGSFMDQSSIESLTAYFDDFDREMAVVETVLAQQWAVVGDSDSGNAVVFGCGMGDGVYPVWLGRSSHGDLVQIAADLELLSHSVPPADR